MVKQGSKPQGEEGKMEQPANHANARETITEPKKKPHGSRSYNHRRSPGAFVPKALMFLAGMAIYRMGTFRFDHHMSSIVHCVENYTSSEGATHRVISLPATTSATRNEIGAEKKNDHDVQESKDTFPAPTSNATESVSGPATATGTSDTKIPTLSQINGGVNKFSNVTRIKIGKKQKGKGKTTTIPTGGINEGDGKTKKTQPQKEKSKSPEELQVEFYKATKKKFYDTEAWKDASTFTTVNRTAYRQLAQIAQLAAAPVAKGVYTDCELHLMPPDALTDASDNKKQLPLVRFRCLRDARPAGKTKSMIPLQDKLCHTVNMCKVVMNETVWKDAQFSPSGSLSNATTIAQYENGRSILLMMVDSLDYLTEYRTFQSTINKGSYAYRTNRPFYIWIGDLNQTQLNARNIESVYDAFGAKCATKKLLNSMHYYKPIALLVLLDIISSTGEGSSIFFLDADSDFTAKAFDLIEDIDLSVGPEAYLGLSPQASLMGTQNVKGKMLMNSGLFILRNTQWSRDFAALWWYARCGEKDQLALWIILFATFSAWTSMPDEANVPRNSDDTMAAAQFAYPGQSFFNYDQANTKTFGHFRKHGHAIQATWEAVVENSKRGNHTVDDTYHLPVPTNTKLYNGGTFPGLRPVLNAPMELPHVMILPQKDIHYEAIVQKGGSDAATTVEAKLPRFKSDNGKSLIAHSKKLESCSDSRCWPFYVPK